MLLAIQHDGGFTVPRLGDDLNVGLLVEDLRHAVSDNGVVVGQQNSDGRARQVLTSNVQGRRRCTAL